MQKVAGENTVSAPGCASICGPSNTQHTHTPAHTMCGADACIRHTSCPCCCSHAGVCSLKPSPHLYTASCRQRAKPRFQTISVQHTYQPLGGGHRHHHNARTTSAAHPVHADASSAQQKNYCSHIDCNVGSRRGRHPSAASHSTIRHKLR